LVENFPQRFALARGRGRGALLQLGKISLTNFLVRNFLLTKMMARAKRFSPQ
jgi:hypothetical protein